MSEDTTSSYPEICKFGDMAVIEDILKDKATEFHNTRNKLKQNALTFAVQRESPESALKLLKLLVEEYKLDIFSQDEMEQTCLFYAAREGHYDCCLYLLEKGLPVDHKDNYGQTSLFYAAREGHINIIQLFHKYGADVNIIDKVRGETALFYAATHNQKKAAKALVQEYGANPAIKNNFGKTAASMSKKKANSQPTSLFLEYLTRKAIESYKCSQDVAVNPEKQPITQTNSHSELQTNRPGQSSGQGLTQSKVSKKQIHEGNLKRNLPGKTESHNTPNLLVSGSPNLHISASSSISTSTLTSLQSESTQENQAKNNQINMTKRMKFRLEYQSQPGKWIIPTDEQITIFEERFPEIAIWTKQPKD